MSSPLLRRVILSITAAALAVVGTDGLRSCVMLRLAEHALADRDFEHAVSYATKVRYFTGRRNLVLVEVARSGDFSATWGLKAALTTRGMVSNPTKDTLLLCIAENWLSHGYSGALDVALAAHAPQDRRRALLLRIADASLHNGEYQQAIKVAMAAPAGDARNSFLLRVAEQAAQTGHSSPAIESILHTDLPRQQKTAQIMRVLRDGVASGQYQDVYYALSTHAKDLAASIDHPAAWDEVIALRNTCLSEKGIVIPEAIEVVHYATIAPFHEPVPVLASQETEIVRNAPQRVREACSFAGLIPLTAREVRDQPVFGEAGQRARELPRLVMSIEIRPGGQVHYGNASGDRATRFVAIARALCKVYDAHGTVSASFEITNSEAPPRELSYSTQIRRNASGSPYVGGEMDAPGSAFRPGAMQSQDDIDWWAADAFMSSLPGELSAKLERLAAFSSRVVAKKK